jgi:hypothetical protein
MRYPNLRYGNPAELNYYAMQYTVDQLARLLRRDARTVRDWMTCRTRVPWWVPELLRLRRMEAIERHRQMNMGSLVKGFGLVLGDVIELRVPETKKPQITDLRLDDFEAIRKSG